jgi:hypothetical protein
LPQHAPSLGVGQVGCGCCEGSQRVLIVGHGARIARRGGGVTANVRPLRRRAGPRAQGRKKGVAGGAVAVSLILRTQTATVLLQEGLNPPFRSSAATAETGGIAPFFAGCSSAVAAGCSTATADRCGCGLLQPSATAGEGCFSLMGCPC